MFARKQETKVTEPALTVLPAASATPPYMENWFAIIRLGGEPRIVMVDDISDRTGHVYMKCILMGSGTIVWVEESNLIMWAFPPVPLPKPTNIAKWDYVRLVDGQTAFIIEISGDLITVLTEGDVVLQLARWDVLRILESGMDV